MRADVTALDTTERFESVGPIDRLALFLLAVVAHLPVLWNRLALDDAIVLANPVAQSPRTLPALLASGWWYTTNRLYRPFTLLTFAVERGVAGSVTWVPHVVNLVLHGVVVVLLGQVLARLLPRTAALVGAGFFAVLPAHTEAVASVVGRAELLAALWMLALALLVMRDEAPSVRDRLMAGLLGALALASKEGGVAAPAVAFATAIAWPAQRRHAARWTVATVAGTCTLLLARLAVLGTLGGDLPNPVFRAMDGMHRAQLALAIVPRTLVALVLPVRAPIDYVPAWPEIVAPAPWLVFAGVATVIAAGLAIALHVRRPGPVGLGAWISASTLAPTANLLFASGVVLSGRTLYAPALGVALMVGALVARASTLPLSRRATWGAAAVLLAWSAVQGWRESRVWRESHTVIVAMAARHPDDYRAHGLLGYEARDAGRPDEALSHFREAAARYPGDPEMLTDAAALALGQRDTAEAEQWLSLAVAASPDARRARTRLATIYLRDGDTLRARELLVEGLRREPGQAAWRALLAALHRR